MRASAALAVVGLAAVLGQHFGRGEGFPVVAGLGLLLVIGLVALMAAVVIGLARGSTLYRGAVFLAVASIAAVAIATMVPFRGRPGVESAGPSLGQLILLAGILLGVLAVSVGAFALWRERRPEAQ